MAKRVRILGGGWYGCHLARALIGKGHSVELHESTRELFSGASGNMPGRLHLGFHYPRSRLTRAACQDHYRLFMSLYGDLTQGVPVNIYAIAENSSLVDFGNYCQSLKNEVEYVTIEHPSEFGLHNVEGALLTGERHTVISKARDYFTKTLAPVVRYSVRGSDMNEADFDLTVDCTFCAQENAGVDRYEPCITAIVQGETTRAITIMDGPFPSLYPWDEGLLSLTSAKWTPLSKTCRTYDEAAKLLAEASDYDLEQRCFHMISDMMHFYPNIRKYHLVKYKLAIRAMPLSGADARLVDIVRVSDKTVRVRASKLDAIFYAEDEVCRLCL